MNGLPVDSPPTDFCYEYFNDRQKFCANMTANKKKMDSVCKGLKTVEMSYGMKREHCPFIFIVVVEILSNITLKPGQL